MRQCDKSSILDSIFVQFTIIKSAPFTDFKKTFGFDNLNDHGGTYKHQNSQTTQRRLHLNEV